MKKIISKIGVHGLVAMCISLLLMTPAYLFPYFSDKSILWFRFKYLWIFMAFGAVLALCRSFKVIAATLIFLGLLEFSQFCSLAYSGDFLTPYSIEFMLREFSEVVGFTHFEILQFWWVPCLILIPYGLMFFLLWKCDRYLFKMKWASVLVLLFILFPAVRVRVHNDRSDILNFFSTPANPTLVNTLNTYAVLGAIILPDRLFYKPSRTFKPYVIKPIPNSEGPKTIVLIMGESMTANHMGIFGYDRPNTPFLSSMANDPNFAFKKGFSDATSTRSTFPMFFCVQYHPENIENMAHQRANLFHLAKQQGFHTIYISAQNKNCLNGIQTSAIDVMITYETEPALFDALRDDALLNLARRMKLGPRNFIVLHQRNVHAPYQLNYIDHPELGKYPVDGLPLRKASVNAYDNAISYNDLLYREIITYFKKRIPPPLYLWITSDHGESLGEEGFWGHDRLCFNTATVPIMFYGTGAATKYVDRIRALYQPTHYEMGKLIAEQIGYDIINPNEEKDVFYIQGVVSLGKGGYMKCRRDTGNVTIQSEFVR